MNNSELKREAGGARNSALLLWAIATAASLIGRVPFLLRNFRKVLINESVFGKIMEDGRITRLLEFQELWDKLRENMDFNRELLSDKYTLQLKYLTYEGKSAKDAVLDLICDDQEILLENGRIRFSDRDTLWILLNEIYIHEEYYFLSDNETPTIIDCGCHFGLATIYFKHLYPRAKIIAFEPIPAVRELAQRNIDDNHLSDVQMLPYALSDTDSVATFYVPDKSPMGSSLIHRQSAKAEKIAEYKVQCKKLSAYLKVPVNYLKLDIEGAEYDVIREIRHDLKNVQYLFCECHNVDKTSGEKMAELLGILGQAGFDYQCAGSWSTQVRTAYRPMNFTQEPLSNVVWASNRNWKS